MKLSIPTHSPIGLFYLHNELRTSRSVRDNIGTMVMPLVTSLFAVTGDGSCVHYEAGRANAAGS